MEKYGTMRAGTVITIATDDGKCNGSFLCQKLPYFKHYFYLFVRYG